MSKIPIMSTAGAVPVRTEKGDFRMEKVKVSRYVSGKRPDYAPELSEEDEDMDLSNLTKVKLEGVDQIKTEAQRDNRLRRIQEYRKEVDSDDEEDVRLRRHQSRKEEMSSDEEGDVGVVSSESEAEEELNEEELEKRRMAIRMKGKEIKREEELMDLEEEKMSDDEAELDSSEDDEMSGSEEEDARPRVKPVFVRKKDRITIQEKEKAKEEQEKENSKRKAFERRQQTLEWIRNDTKRQAEEEKSTQDPIDMVDSDDGDDDEEFKVWQAREARRNKKHKDEREAFEKDKQEAERLHGMTEEERRQELKVHPKQITNKTTKQKYKFLQKYYHRGVFYLDQEDNIFKRDFSAPTLEDHFNKTVLPKVMQVKNFGRSGRTKYTHLVDQDTTQFDSPWIADTNQNLKFFTNRAGGMKQLFYRPSAKKNKAKTAP